MARIMKLTQAKQISKSRELGVLLNSTLMQRRILYSCLAVMNPVVPDLKGMTHAELWDWILENGRLANRLRTYHLDIHDFARVWKLTSAKDVKGKLQSAIGYTENTGTTKIMNLCFKHQVDSKTSTFINVFSSVKIDRERSAITIRFTDDILPFLINLASYTAIPFKATVGFKCNYSFAMLEYLLMRHHRDGSDHQTHTLTLEALHMVLGTNTQSSYQKWTNFKARVLDPIQTDFSQIHGGGYDISFTALLEDKANKGRRKVERIEITFSNLGIKRFIDKKRRKQEALELIKNE